jgi:hypothetical protein
MKGFIYVMSNESLKDNLLKIGKSSRHPESFRKSELETTGVPGKFVVEYVALTINYDEYETKIHKVLENCRYNHDREFFSIDLIHAYFQIQKLMRDGILYEEKSEKIKFNPDEIIRIEDKYEDGNLRKVTSMKNFQLWGQYQEYHTNGILRLRTNFVEGVENGMRKEYNGNGDVINNGHMFKGKKQGEWLTVNKKWGEEKRYFDEGKRVGTWSIFSKGGRRLIEKYEPPSKDYESKVYRGTESLKDFSVD